MRAPLAPPDIHPFNWSQYPIIEFGLQEINKLATNFDTQLSPTKPHINFYGGDLISRPPIASYLAQVCPINTFDPISHGIFDPAVPRGGVYSTPPLENTLGGV